MSHGTKIIHDYKQKITAQPIINIHTFQTMNVILKIQKFRQQLLFKKFCQKFWYSALITKITAKSTTSHCVNLFLI